MVSPVVKKELTKRQKGGLDEENLLDIKGETDRYGKTHREFPCCKHHLMLSYCATKTCFSATNKGPSHCQFATWTGPGLGGLYNGGGGGTAGHLATVFVMVWSATRYRSVKGLDYVLTFTILELNTR